MIDREFDKYADGDTMAVDVFRSALVDLGIDADDAYLKQLLAKVEADEDGDDSSSSKGKDSDDNSSSTGKDSDDTSSSRAHDNDDDSSGNAGSGGAAENHKEKKEHKGSYSSSSSSHSKDNRSVNTQTDFADDDDVATGATFTIDSQHLITKFNSICLLRSPASTNRVAITLDIRSQLTSFRLIATFLRGHEHSSA